MLSDLTVEEYYVSSSLSSLLLSGSEGGGDGGFISGRRGEDVCLDISGRRGADLRLAGPGKLSGRSGSLGSCGRGLLLAFVFCVCGLGPDRSLNFIGDPASCIGWLDDDGPLLFIGRSSTSSTSSSDS